MSRPGREAAAFPRGPRPWAAAQYDDAGFLFSRIGARANMLFTGALEPLGLRPKHYSVLNYLDGMDGSMQRALVEGLWIDSSTMVTLIDDFERLGLAERRAHPADRRAYAVYLSPRGRRLLAEMRKVARAVEEQILAPFDEEERRVLRAFLVRAAGGAGGGDPDVEPDAASRAASRPAPRGAGRSRSGAPARPRRAG